MEECDEIMYNNEIIKLFFYTDGEYGGSPELKKLLSYISCSSSENATDKELDWLHDAVCRLKENSQIGVKYMLFREAIEDEIREASEKAREEEEQRLNILSRKLLEAGRRDDIIKAVLDIEYKKKLFEEFGI